ncbi:TetR/AcrR family transcriptional regulator C-terminal domain-containing protein [Nocardia uniformis]|uniref:TetR/AcrR family transcriptional regulator C-terminal domain-containing protein n=1 Tax=Nocardia uniformis TaxID=53432 RepID=UPI0008347635|nr:TetR/AcrR family transcriptional regulator C-terminal domain-containing protein [Nocardia uniformis]
MLTGPIVRLRRLLIGEAERFPELAAEHFAFLVMGASLNRALFEATTPYAPEGIEKRAHAGIDTFLRAYR